jgi:hypothetical protein
MIGLLVRRHSTALSAALTAAPLLGLLRVGYATFGMRSTVEFPEAVS